MDNYINGFENRKNRYIQYDRIDSIINGKVFDGTYNKNSCFLDMVASEEKHCFCIRCGLYPGYIVFNSVSEFSAWING